MTTECLHINRTIQEKLQELALLRHDSIIGWSCGDRGLSQCRALQQREQTLHKEPYTTEGRIGRALLRKVCTR